MREEGRLILALLLACSTAPDCDAACQRDAALASWRADPQGTTARVRAIEDAQVRAIVILALAEKFPGEMGELCGDVEEGFGRERCERLVKRPHLRGPARPEGVPKAPTRDAPGPATDNLPRVALTLTPRKPDADPCGQSPDPQTCLDAAAAKAAVDGDGAGAAGLCELSVERKNRDECVFQAAEAGIRARGADSFADTVRLCDAAGGFVEQCLGHVISYVVPPVPPSAAITADDAKTAVAVAEKVRAAIAPADAAAATLYVDRYWAQYFSTVYRGDQPVRGQDPALFPPEAAPHIRAAATYVIERRSPGGGDLAARVARAAELLSQTHRDHTNAPPRPGDLVNVKNLWPMDAPDERGIPAVYYLGGSRRPVSDDPDTDLALCVLEAAARQQPPDVGFLEAAQADARPVVAQSAARLLAAVRKP